MADPSDFKWAIPIMRAGYAGRGLVYGVIAGFSLFAIWYGGQAKGTSSALAQLENQSWGSVVLFLIFLGMLAYAVWRLVDSVWDLEDYGTEAKGMIARTGMIVTGILHLGIGISAFLLLFTSKDGGGQSKVVEIAGEVMQWPFGPYLVIAIGLATIGTGIYTLTKALKEKYREKLYANEFTRNYNKVLKAGVTAKGVIVSIIGAFIVYAGWTADPQKAGGVGKSFDWLSGQVYGQILVVCICLGLVGFSIFCFVNAAYRIVPKAAGDDVVSLASV